MGEPFEGVTLPAELRVDDCERLFGSRGSGEPSPPGRCGERVFRLVGRSLEVDSRLSLRSSRACEVGGLPSFWALALYRADSFRAREVFYRQYTLA